MKTFIYAVD